MALSSRFARIEPPLQADALQALARVARADGNYAEAQSLLKAPWSWCSQRGRGPATGPLSS